MRKANRNLKKPTFLKEIGPISNSFSFSNTREQRLFVWKKKIVSCKIKVQIIGEKMTFTSRLLVDPREISPASL